MSMKHTPGPFFVVPYGDGDSLVICTDKSGNHRIAFMAVPGARDQDSRKKTWKQIKANARLIAAAPELLEALLRIAEEKAPRYHDCVDNGEPECAWCAAFAAIAKALGQS